MEGDAHERRWLQALADEQFCHLTTIGRRSGQPHTIEIWFAMAGDRMYLLAQNGERADWVRNLRVNPRVQVRVGTEERDGIAHALEPAAEPEADAQARRLIVGKYEGWHPGQPLHAWAVTALPVAIEFPRR